MLALEGQNDKQQQLTKQSEATEKLLITYFMKVFIGRMFPYMANITKNTRRTSEEKKYHISSQ